MQGNGIVWDAPVEALPKKVGIREIWFRGLNCYYERLVWLRADGTYWIGWYYESVQVEQEHGIETEMSGWRTVLDYGYQRGNK